MGTHMSALMKMNFGVKFRLEVKCEHNGEVGLWPLEDLADDNKAKIVWAPAEPEPEPGRKRCQVGLSAALIGLAVLLCTGHCDECSLRGDPAE